MLARKRLLTGVWESIAVRGFELLAKRGFVKTAPLASLCRDLLSERGEASGTALGRELGERYRELTPKAREAFLVSLLGSDFLPDPKTVNAAAEAYRMKPDSETLAALIAVAEPPRQELFRRINLAPGGTALVLEMRSDLLRILPARPELKPVDADMRHLLGSWFNRGFLRLERIDWSTPALVLEKIIEHEAVHAIEGWDDLRRRLAADRRCFAFFHPALPNEPLIFIEIALTRGMPASVQALLDRTAAPRDDGRADTAAFYSITSCLEGLRGISFGNFLIKQVVAELEAEELGLKSYVTLSPMPDFRKWFDALPEERRDPSEQGLTRLAAQYLLTERKRDRAYDPVAAFHLGNGASVEQIHFGADLSEKGRAQSFGIMVSYGYRASQLERNHEAYVKHGRVAASAGVRALLGRSKAR
ncbi:MAG TPA: malonyl-CoA decarboxylase family protein [Bryobacteraceae bacterium]|nr:malonyl-CoA decarboxylase family protein [Bryobacteraceae bacterium]